VSYALREAVLVTLNVVNGVTYVLLSGLFAAFYLLLASSIERDRREGVIGDRLRAVAIVGTALFLAGCGIMHLHDTLETMPAVIEHGPLATDPYVGDDAIVHHLLIDGSQAIGGPMLVCAMVVTYLRLRRQRAPRVRR
jgi:hypothetical protein